jgi:hypothetical protein
MELMRRVTAAVAGVRLEGPTANLDLVSTVVEFNDAP